MPFALHFVSLLVFAGSPPHHAHALTPCTSGGTTLSSCVVSDTLLLGATGESGFQVRNAGGADRVYQARCLTTPPVRACRLEVATLTVHPGEQRAVRLRYAAGAETGTGSVTLELDGGGGEAVAGTVSVTVVKKAP